MQHTTVVITAPKDLIPYTVTEVKKLGYSPLWKNDSAIGVRGTFNDALLLNLWLRTAHHVLYTLKEFTCRDLTALYRNISSIP